MKILELFSGNGDISKSFRELGWEIYRVDWSGNVEAELHADISKLTTDDIVKLCGGIPDVIWASPDCTTYSIATHKHRTLKDGLKPLTEYAKVCDETNTYMWDLIEKLEKLGTQFWFVENPRGRMRHMPFVSGKKMHTITYCQYGREIMKPTDIWTNHPDPMFKKPCSVGDDCHAHGKEADNIRNKGGKDRYLNRGLMPKELCDHIAYICDRKLSVKNDWKPND